MFVRHDSLTQASALSQPYALHSYSLVKHLIAALVSELGNSTHLLKLASCPDLMPYRDKPCQQPPAIYV